MRRRIIYFIVVLCGLCLTGAAAAEGLPQRGSLYRVSYQGNTAYLFGTIHVGRPTFYPLEDKVTQALAQASKIAVELDVRNNEPFQAALGKYGMYRSGESLMQQLSPDTQRQLQAALDRYGIPLSAVTQMKPWLVANLLLGVDLERHGYQRTHGVEHFLLASTNVQAKTVLELESADYQMSLFDSMNSRQQEAYLREHLAELQNGVALKKAQDLIDAWSRADGKVYEALLRDAVNEKTTSAEFTLGTLLNKRNPEMAAKIETLLNNDKSTFVGIGLLHLTGEAGVPALLQQRGYQVEKLY